MAEAAEAPDLERLRAERDLYAKLLDLGGEERVEPFLREALALVLGLARARRGYLELRREDGRSDERPWGLAHGYSDADVRGLRERISRGIVGEAIATGRTVATASALVDPRFGSRESVQLARIEAVLCAPIGAPVPIGVVYLEGRPEGGPWSEADRELVERFARHLAPIADVVLERHARAEARDETRAVRQGLRADAMIGRSGALSRVLQQAALVAPLEVTVLLGGPSGTGKSLLARVIHDNGPRARGPFIELNCAALPEGLFESELFGFRAGAHSTATKRGVGKVAAAAGGTLFLDDVGELGLPAQAKLLQFLQSKTYFPLGAAQPERADVRVIAASNLDLERAVAERRFREDLFYRLQVMPIRLPPLAERPEDIALLAEYACRQACERNGLALLRLSPRALAAIEAAAWPGNVRQLVHAVEAGAIRAAGEGAARVEERHVFDGARERAANGASEVPTFQEATRRFQRELLLATLAETDWNVAEASRRLDLARSHVYNLIRTFGLERA